MGMAAILVMWPGPFEQDFVPPSQGGSIWNLASIGPVVSEEIMFENVDIQATPAMSTSRISILPLMSKWFFIPNIFSLYFFAFQLRLCRKRLTRSNGYLEVIFHALNVFSIIFASVYVEVLNRRSHGRHIVCFGYVHVLAEVRTSSKQQ